MKFRFILGGDFNSKHPRWGSNVTNPRGIMLYDQIFKLNLEIAYPFEPTHYPDSGHMPDLLDFFIGKQIQHFCNVPRVIHELSSDHLPVLLTLSAAIPNSCNKYTLIRHPFNWNEYVSCLDISTNLKIPLKNKRDIDMAINTLTNNIKTAANTASSNSSNFNRIRRKTVFPPHILQLQYVERSARALWQRTKYPPHKQNYNKATQELKLALKELYSEATDIQLKSLDSKDGSLWRKTRQITKETEKIPPLKYDNQWLTSPNDKTEIFSKILEDQFKPNDNEDNITTLEVNNTLDQPLQLSPICKLFTPAEVRNTINRLPAKKAPGHDYITQPLLLQLPRRTIVLFTQIYNAMIRLSYFPSTWKHANIVMIPKPNKFVLIHLTTDL
ncbi:hypothetical protein ANN_14625 [Periplaneta americana]|uniref:Endonuclease/exonuclease/phosphatase domain-containing protein n=1 Tax=Periplaneta americana TaxID=6978 RepID=A0ABQ8SY30_PERAM|nr:hypothetical protein ANN_14625 [Periplaneta americana]